VDHADSASHLKPILHQGERAAAGAGNLWLVITFPRQSQRVGGALGPPMRFYRHRGFRGVVVADAALCEEDVVRRDLRAQGIPLPCCQIPERRSFARAARLQCNIGQLPSGSLTMTDHGEAMFMETDAGKGPQHRGRCGGVVHSGSCHRKAHFTSIQAVCNRKRSRDAATWRAILIGEIHNKPGQQTQPPQPFLSKPCAGLKTMASPGPPLNFCEDIAVHGAALPVARTHASHHPTRR